MAFEEKQAHKIEVNENLSIGVRRADIILKDGVEVGRSYHRSLFEPGDDVSGEVQVVQDIAAVIWTPEVIDAYAAAHPQAEADDDHQSGNQAQSAAPAEDGGGA